MKHDQVDDLLASMAVDDPTQADALRAYVRRLREEGDTAGVLEGLVDAAIRTEEINRRVEPILERHADATEAIARVSEARDARRAVLVKVLTSKPLIAGYTLLTVTLAAWTAKALGVADIILDLLRALL